MGQTRFRVFFGDASTREDLVRIEEIEVTQEMDAMWEARIKMVTDLSTAGTWRHRLDEIAKPFARVRVELDPGTGSFVPLIDGPVTGFDTALDSQPGRSAGTLVVRDDSVFLHRDENVEVFENRRDSDIAEEIFRRAPQIRETFIDATAETHRAAVRRGTPMQFLHQLARADDRHAFVLPGARRGESIGCFLANLETPADLPPLVLIGRKRSITDAEISDDFELPETTAAQALRIADQQIVGATKGPGQLVLMNTRPSVGDAVARRLVAPADNVREDPAPGVVAQCRRNSYAIHLKSRIVFGTYGAVLTPYRKVPVFMSKTPYSGEYLITKVVHRITRSLYSQEFEAHSDSVAAVEGSPGAAGLSAGVF